MTPVLKMNVVFSKFMSSKAFYLNCIFLLILALVSTKKTWSMMNLLMNVAILHNG